MRRILIACLLAFGLVSTSQAQTADAAQIIVMGIGVIERPADWAVVSFSIVGEGKTSVEALRALTTKQALIEGKLTALVGATAVSVESDELKVLTVKGDDCEDGERYRPSPTLSEGACAVRGYVASMNMTAKVSPASRAGDIASLAAELGGSSVEMARAGVNDPNALAVAALRAAVANARVQAEVIAAASGVRLGPILRIQDPLTRDDDAFGPAPAKMQALRPPAETIAPQVAVEITVPTVSQAIRLSVVFSVIR